MNTKLPIAGESDRGGAKCKSGGIGDLDSRGPWQASI